MGSTLEHGIYLPSEGEKNCYSGLANNWQAVDTNIGYVTALRQAIAGALTRQIVTQLPTEDIDPNCIYMILKATAQTSNIYDEYMYINSSYELIGDSQLDLSNYYTKQEVNQLPAVASGITGTKVDNYDAHIANGDIHVTASDKAKWDTLALIKHLRLVNAQVGSATTIPFSDFDDTNGIKVGDKCADLDVKVFEITAVDTANQTVTVSPLLDIALDANVVHNSGAETVGGIKTFSDETYIKSLNFTNEVPSQSSSSSSILPIIATITYGDSSPSVQARLNLRVTAEGVKSLYPHESGVYSLGLISRIWSDFYSAHAYLRGQQQNDEYSGNARTNLTLMANRDTLGQSGCLIDTFRENTAQGTGGHIIGFGIKEDSVRYEGCRFSWLWDNNLNGYRFAFRPTLQGTNQAKEHHIGLSTDKWDKINGVTPSSLSLPDLDNAIDISGYITNLTGEVENTYTPLVNGWLCVRIVGNGLSVRQGDLACTNTYVTSTSGDRWAESSLPVSENVQVFIRCRSGTSVVSAKFYPCLGNV